MIGDEVEAGLQHRQEQLEHRRAVGQDRRDDVALLQPQRAQAVHDLVARGEQLACRMLACRRGRPGRGVLGRLAAMFQNPRSVIVPRLEHVLVLVGKTTGAPVDRRSKNVF